MNKEQVKKVLNEKLQSKRLSCWNRGVIYYCYDLLEKVEEKDLPNNFFYLEKLLLNGADNWQDFSWGGKSLLNNFSICDRLTTPTERKRTKNGLLDFNTYEKWLDVQARGLEQGFHLIYLIVNNLI